GQTQRCTPELVEHLAAHDAQNNLRLFARSAEHGWTSMNATQLTGAQMATQVTAWQTPNGPFNVEHLAGANPSGELLNFFTRDNDLLVAQVVQDPPSCQRAISFFAATDTQPPTVTIAQPTSDATLTTSDANIDVSGTATDDRFVTQVT